MLALTIATYAASILDWEGSTAQKVFNNFAKIRASIYNY